MRYEITGEPLYKVRTIFLYFCHWIWFFYIKSRLTGVCLYSSIYYVFFIISSFEPNGTLNYNLYSAWVSRKLEHSSWILSTHLTLMRREGLRLTSSGANINFWDRDLSMLIIITFIPLISYHMPFVQHLCRSDPKRLASTLKKENEESCTTYNMLKVR